MFRSLCGVLVGLFAASAAGQDAVEIKVAYAKTSDRVKVTFEEKTETSLSITIGGKEMSTNSVKTKSLVYVDEIIDNPRGQKLADKLKRTYEKAVVGTDGKVAALPIEGKTVLIEKKGDKYAFSVDGKPVDADSLKLLDAEFNNTDKVDVRELMFPNKAVKPGESWKINSEKLVKVLSERGLQMETTKVVAGGTLVKAFKQDDMLYGVIELKVTAPLSGLGPKAAFKLKEGALTVSITGTGVIDGMSPKGKSETTMRLAVAGTNDGGAETKITATTTETRTSDPLPKK